MTGSGDEARARLRVRSESSERLVSWPWRAAVASFVVGYGFWLTVLLFGLVAGGVLALRSAAVVGVCLGGFVLVSMLSHRLIVDEEGVELVSLLRRRRIAWSEIARLQASMESYRTLEIVLKGPPEQRLKAGSAIPVGKVRLRLLIETMNDHAERRGVPSTVTVEKLYDGDRVE